MLRQILTVAGLAGVIGTAHAGSLMETVEYGAEVPLVELDLPTAEGGNLRFSACENCEIHTVVMSGSTDYLVNNRPVSFADLVATVDTARKSAEIAKRSLVGLYFDAASKRLVRISVIAPVPR